VSRFLHRSRQGQVPNDGAGLLPVGVATVRQQARDPLPAAADQVDQQHQLPEQLHQPLRPIHAHQVRPTACHDRIFLPVPRTPAVLAAGSASRQLSGWCNAGGPAWQTRAAYTVAGQATASPGSATVISA
jgi:hypothetical protein